VINSVITLHPPAMAHPMSIPVDGAGIPEGRMVDDGPVAVWEFGHVEWQGIGGGERERGRRKEKGWDCSLVV
jgi:hypothetical protein